MNIGNLAWERVFEFLNRSEFTGFTNDDLFIKRFIPTCWGQDIAALSNIAEAIQLREGCGLIKVNEAQSLIDAVVKRALHKSVSPYRRPVNEMNDLGKHGYYLEHLNIILGVSCSLGLSTYSNLNLRISEHLRDLSISQDNAHAPLMPHVRMRWSADQAAILNSLWLCDQNHQTDFHTLPADLWLTHMKREMTHKETGLFETEALRVKRYSRQPRGCSLAYMIHYMSGFAAEVAAQQWELFKTYMLQESMGLTGFREYLSSYNGKWTPDTGPILYGIGVAATGLGLKTATSIGDTEMRDQLKHSVDMVLGFCYLTNRVPAINNFSAIGTDLLASSVYLNSCAPNSQVTSKDIRVVSKIQTLGNEMTARR